MEMQMRSTRSRSRALAAVPLPSASSAPAPAPARAPVVGVTDRVSSHKKSKPPPDPPTRPRTRSVSGRLPRVSYREGVGLPTRGQPGPAPEIVECVLGCGAVTAKGHMHRHQLSPHYLCRCGKMVAGSIQINRHARLGGCKRRRKVRSRGAEVSAAPAGPDSALRYDRPTPPPPSSSSSSPSPAAWSPGSARKLDQILGEIRACLRQEPARPSSSRKKRRLSHLEKVDTIFPAGADIPWVRVWRPGDLDPDAADIWQLTADQLAELGRANKPLPKPILIPAATDSPTTTTPPVGGERIPAFLARLGRRFAGGLVDIQDADRAEKGPVSMPVEAAVARFAAARPSVRSPINLLSLRGDLMGASAPAAPEFLDQARFDIIPALSARLDGEADPSRRLNAGKRSVAVACPVDLAAATSFCLLSQRGCWSGFHVDVCDGTWVRSIEGRKVWIFPARFGARERTQLERQADDWLPACGVRVLVLEPGATLVMPPGPVTPHAVFSIEDSLATGGMFFDLRCILSTLENVYWMARQPCVTNEAVPAQLLLQWGGLRELVLADDPAAGPRLDDITRRMRAILSCSCSSSTSGRTGAGGRKCGCSASCPCLTSPAQDFRCTPWCHDKASADSSSGKLLPRQRKRRRRK